MSEAQTIADLATKAAGASIIRTDDGRELLILPDGFTSCDVSDPRGITPGVPSRIRQALTLQTVDSLAEYVNRFKGSDTTLFADIAANRIVAVLDYHGADQAANVDHRASMELPFSEEWRAWTAISGRLMSQLDFARFIEENAADVAVPSGADLLEVVRDLQAHRKVNFTKAVRTSSDNENFEYSDTTEARSTKGAVEIPTKFQLALPVYFGEAPTSVFAFLRWRLNDSSLELGVVLHRAEHVRQAVFKEIVAKVGKATGCPVVFGKLA